MVSAIAFAEQAKKGGYIGIPYKKLDCQAFVEQVMKDLDCLPVNWRGSNHMWRDAVYNRTKIVDTSLIPIGAWLFTVKDDGKEREKGYYDGLKNAVHVGIYLGDNKVIHSTSTAEADGVQYSDIWDKRWTHYALCKYLDYSNQEECNQDEAQTPPTSHPRVVKYIDVTDLSNEQFADVMQYLTEMVVSRNG